MKTHCVHIGPTQIVRQNQNNLPKSTLYKFGDQNNVNQLLQTAYQQKGPRWYLTAKTKINALTFLEGYVTTNMNRYLSVTQAVKWKYMNRARECQKSHSRKSMNSQLYKCLRLNQRLNILHCNVVSLSDFTFLDEI